jgi:hypothetical protein
LLPGVRSKQSLRIPSSPFEFPSERSACVDSTGGTNNGEFARDRHTPVKFAVAAAAAAAAAATAAAAAAAAAAVALSFLGAPTRRGALSCKTAMSLQGFRI